MKEIPKNLRIDTIEFIGNGYALIIRVDGSEKVVRTHDLDRVLTSELNDKLGGSENGNQTR